MKLDLLVRMLGHQSFYPGVVFGLDLADVQRRLPRHAADDFLGEGALATADFENAQGAREIDFAHDIIHEKSGTADNQAIFADIAFDLSVEIDGHKMLWR